MQLDRLSREEKRSERISASHPCGCSLYDLPGSSRKTGLRRRPVEVDRLSKNGLMAEAFAGLFLRERERERERCRKTPPTFQTRREGNGERVAYIS